MIYLPVRMSKKKDKGEEKRNKHLMDELKDCKDENLRLKADFENYKKQLDRDKEQFARLANEELIRELLNIVDDMERAIGDKEVNGFRMIHKNFIKILERMGLKRIECLEKKFDPHYHEVMYAEESEQEAGTILEEFQAGYMLKDKVIRHSKVKIAK